MHILFVEDSQTTREMVITYIMQEFPSVKPKFTCCETVTKALITLKTKQVDVIILDLILKDSEPKETLNAFKNSMEIPTVIFSSSTDQDVITQAAKSGAVGYVEKPDLKNLHYAMANAFERKKLSDAVARLEENYQELKTQMENLKDAVHNVLPPVKDKEETVKGG